MRHCGRVLAQRAYHCITIFFSQLKWHLRSMFIYLARWGKPLLELSCRQGSRCSYIIICNRGRQRTTQQWIRWQCWKTSGNALEFLCSGCREQEKTSSVCMRNGWNLKRTRTEQRIPKRRMSGSSSTRSARKSFRHCSRKYDVDDHAGRRSGVFEVPEGGRKARVDDFKGHIPGKPRVSMQETGRRGAMPYDEGSSRGREDE